jgi:hypothetical protein
MARTWKSSADAFLNDRCDHETGDDLLARLGGGLGGARHMPASWMAHAAAPMTVFPREADG